jgi:hypothetical protein
MNLLGLLQSGMAETGVFHETLKSVRSSVLKLQHCVVLVLSANLARWCGNTWSAGQGWNGNSLKRN